MSEHDEATHLKLAEVVDGFCRRLEEGADPDPAGVLTEHPDLPDLAACLQGLAAVEELRGQLTPAEDEALPEAPRLPHYKIVRELGRGGPGIVYEARDLRFLEGRRVAVKMIKAGALASPEERRRFQAEAQIAARLQHANIVAIYEVNEHAGEPFLAMELVAGGSLRDKLAGAPLPPLEAARLVETLARAVHHAHEHGVVHRDLKPANILLTADGTPKISDFGLAKQLGDDTARTRTGQILGTSSYMAPEQASGQAHNTGPTADVYALGAILYELLTGRPPFRGATEIDTLDQVRNQEPVPPRRLQPLVPFDLQTICLKCLNKTPAQRYTTAQDLGDDLGRFLRGEPIRARPIGVAGRLVRWCRRNPLVAALVGVATVLSLIVATLAVARLTDAAAAAARAEGRRDEILTGNRSFAQHVASTILIQLMHLAAAVDKTAADPRLSDLLAKKDGAGLQRYFEEVHGADPERGIVGPDGKSAFHTWHLVDSKGFLLADAPRHPNSAIGKDFRGRDYYLGALRRRALSGVGRVHVSRIYRSANDELFKISLSAVVQADRDGPVLGVVCGTIRTDATLVSLELNDERRTAVLVGRRDTNDPTKAPPAEPPAEYLILVHPAYGEHGKGKAEPIAAHVVGAVARTQPGSEWQLPARPASTAQLMRGDYHDPLGERHSDYTGRWLAGFAQVGNTEMVVIVQQRDDAPDSSAGGGWHDWALAAGALLAAAAVAAGWWIWRRQRRTLPVVSPPPAAAAITATDVS